MHPKTLPTDAVARALTNVMARTANAQTSQDRAAMQTAIRAVAHEIAQQTNVGNTRADNTRWLAACGVSTAPFHIAGVTP